MTSFSTSQAQHSENSEWLSSKKQCLEFAFRMKNSVIDDLEIGENVSIIVKT